MDSLSHYWDLVLVLTRKEIKVRYKNHLLGYLWSVASPLAFALVLYVVFSLVAGRFKMQNYHVFLISGLFAWQWFANSVGVSPMIFRSNSSIIKKINFPRSIIPLATVLQDMIHFVLCIPIIVIFLLIFDKEPNWSWRYGVPLLLFNNILSWSWLYGIPLLLGMQLCLTYGIVLIIASVNLFFRDMEKLTNILILLLFYATPVFYPVSKIPPDYIFAVYVNPLAPLIVSWRSLILDGSLNAGYLGVAAAYSAAILAIGYIVYKELCGRFAEVI